MSKLRGKDLTSLYPEPKSYDEINDERNLRKLEGRPRFVSQKISACATLAILVPLAIHKATYHIVESNLSSTGGVMFSVFFSVLSTLVAFGAFFYFYSYINGLASRILVSTTVLYLAIVPIALIVASILLKLTQPADVNLLLVTVVLLFDLIATYLVTKLVLKNQNQDDRLER